MSDKELLNKETYKLYCARHYDASLSVSFEEFENDLDKIKYIKKLITRYRQAGDLQERLILNHIIVLNNVFGSGPTAKILYFKFHENGDFDVIVPFLIKLGIMPAFFFNVFEDGEIVATENMPMDDLVVERVRQL